MSITKKGENVQTLTIPKDTADFYLKKGQCFNLAFSAKGTVKCKDRDFFDPPLPEGPVDQNTPVEAHEAVEKGTVKIYFTSPTHDDASTHTILIGD
jgi:hypothetical protein